MLVLPGADADAALDLQQWSGRTYHRIKQVRPGSPHCPSRQTKKN